MTVVVSLMFQSLRDLPASPFTLPLLWQEEDVVLGGILRVRDARWIFSRSVPPESDAWRLGPLARRSHDLSAGQH